MIIDISRNYTPRDPEYPIWVSTLFINNMKRHFPGRDIVEVIEECFVKYKWHKNTADIVRKVAMDMYLNDEL